MKTVSAVAYTIVVAALSILGYRYLATEGSSVDIRNTTTTGQVSDGRPTQHTGEETSPHSARDSKEYLEILASMGLKTEETMPIIRVHITRRYEAVHAAAPPDYWTPEWDTERSNRISRQQEKDAAVRVKLIEIYGPAAEASEQFADLFRPLSPELSFLSSDQQLAILRFRSEQALGNATRLAHERSPRPNPAAFGSVTGASIGPEDELSALQEVAGAEAAFEYGVRESGTARLLRSTGIRFDEREFRAAYRSMSRAAADPLAASDEIEKVLGREKYVAFKAALDPGFDALKDAAAALDVRPNKVLSVYEIIQDTNSKLRDTQQIQEVDPLRAAQMIQEIMAERRSRIEGLVGLEAATALLDAINRRYQQMSEAGG